MKSIHLPSPSFVVGKTKGGGRCFSISAVDYSVGMPSED